MDKKEHIESSSLINRDKLIRMKFNNLFTKQVDLGDKSGLTIDDTNNQANHLLNLPQLAPNPQQDKSKSGKK